MGAGKGDGMNSTQILSGIMHELKKRGLLDDRYIKGHTKQATKKQAMRNDSETIKN